MRRRLLTALCVAAVAVAACDRFDSVRNDRLSRTPPAAPASEEGPCRYDYLAAGILPYAKRDNRVYVLLGEESRAAGTVWTDFVGTRRDGDCRPAVTAAREFAEESRGSYPSATTLAAIESARPAVLDPPGIYIWILEVADIPASKIEASAGGLYAEKHHYCWVDLTALLESIDKDTRRIPRTCGGHSSNLYDVFEKNLAEGGVARARLEEILRQDDPGRS